MVEITSADVERAYDAALMCFDAVRTLAEKADALAAATYDEAGNSIAPSEDAVRQVLEERERVAGCVETARTAFGPAEEACCAAIGAVQKVHHGIGTSKIQAFLDALGKHLTLGELDLGEPSSETRLWLHTFGNGYVGFEAELRAELRVERTKVKGWVEDQARVVLQEGEETPDVHVRRGHTEIEKLNRLQLRLLDYLEEHRGREVEYEELAERVWGDESTVDNTIQKAVSELKKSLRKTGKGKLADQIVNTRGGYRLG